MKLREYLFGLYCAVGVATFGLAWNLDHVGGTESVVADELNAYRSMLCAMAWPMYWSVQASKGLRP